MAGGLALALLAGSAWGQGVAGPASAAETPTPVLAPAEPALVNGQLVYPGDKPVPRSMTPIERWWVERFGLGSGVGAGTDEPGTPPVGPVFCPGEYAPMQAIMVSWKGGTSLWQILANMGARITTTGNAELWVAHTTAAERTDATNRLTSAGANMSRVRFFNRATDTIWIRDYGPRYIYEGGSLGVRSIVDHTYNRPRANDDALNRWLGPQLRHSVYGLPLVHGGGNYHLDSLTRAYATRLIRNENPSLTEQAIIGLWQAYQNVVTHLFDPYPASVDSTQHIDMWMQVAGDNLVFVSDWPNDPGTTQDQVADNAAAFMAQRGYTVVRLPARRIGTTHFTFTNMVMCNDLVLLPTYTSSGITAAPNPAGGTVNLNTQAVDAVRAALPGKTVVQINCDSIVGLAGVMHCIVMHVPRHLGGVNPTAFLRFPNAGETLQPGQTYTVRWSTDDDTPPGVADLDLWLSTDGGATFPTLVAGAIFDDGEFEWTVPAGAEFTDRARLRIVVRDAQGNAGADVTDVNFTINGTRPCPADFNSDGELTFDDIQLFVSAYNGQEPRADFNDDQEWTFDDIQLFVSAYNAGC
jgi:agmatine/peptidylarginine deiminase